MEPASSATRWCRRSGGRTRRGEASRSRSRCTTTTSAAFRPGSTPRRGRRTWRARRARRARPATGGHGRVPVRRPRGRNRLADLLPATSDRDDGRQHQRLRALLDCAVAQPNADDRSRASSSSRAARSTATRPRRTFRRRRRTAGTFPDRPAGVLRRVEALRRDALRQFRPPARAADARWRARSTTTAPG